MSGQPILRVEGLRKSFGALEVLKGVSFTVEAGERIAIIGPSGSGKSTCLRAINLLERPTDGWIELEGERVGGDSAETASDRALAPFRAKMGMVFQLFHLWPHMTVRDNVALNPRKVGRMSVADARSLADAMLAKVHLTHKADEYPDRLSGGQQQRVAIARALAQRPSVLLFDEPTSALDPELVGEVLNVIRELAQERRAMVLVTHEIRFARDVADRVIFMDGGWFIEQGAPRDILESPKTERVRQFLSQMHRQDN